MCVQVEEDPDAPSLEWEEEYVIPESPPPPPPSSNAAPFCGSNEPPGLKDAGEVEKQPEEDLKPKAGGEEEEEEEEEKQNSSERGEEGQLDSGVEEEETPQGELARSRSDIPEASEGFPSSETTGQCGEANGDGDTYRTLQNFWHQSPFSGILF